MKRNGLSSMLIFQLLSGILSGGNTATVEQVFVKDNKPTIKGSDIQIRCEISQFTDNSVVHLYKSDIPPTDVLSISLCTSCISSRCLGGIIQRHTFRPDSGGLTISVSNLTRSEDQKWWTCAIGTQRKYLYVFVYTISKTLQFDNPLLQNQDLIQNSVTLMCTTGCAYPAPSFTWYIMQVGELRRYWPTSQNITGNTRQCTDMEKVYTSTLVLQKYTVVDDNSDTNARFQCGVVYGNYTSSEILSQPSVNIRFAVKVTTVTLESGNSSLSDVINVTAGISNNFTCTTSKSRPKPTIVWFIGQEENDRVLNSSTANFALIPKIEENGTSIYCKTFNIQPEKDALSSVKVLLNVKERASVNSFKVEGHKGSTNITVNEGDIDVTFTCVISGNPASIVTIKFEGKTLSKSSATNIINFVRQSVACIHSGEYTCEGKDMIGVTTNKTVHLFVNCSPRPVRQIKTHITSVVGELVTLTFSTIAYPTPGSKGFKWYKETFNEWIPLLSNEDLHISSAVLQSNLTLINITKESFGKYKLTVQNSIATYTQYYVLVQKDNSEVYDEINDSKLNVVDTECKTFRVATFILATMIVGGIGCTIVCIFLLKRRTMNKDSKVCQEASHESYKRSFDNTMAEADVQEGATGVYENPTQQYTELKLFSEDERTNYDILQTA